MFEQTFVIEDVNDKKRYTVLVSLLLQVATLCLLVLVPLIYTQVLPQARLRSVFAAPTPPQPALPKAPATTTARPTLSQRPFASIFPREPVTPMVRDTEIAVASPPDLIIGAPEGAGSSLIGDPSGTLQQIKPPDPPRAAPAHPPAAKIIRLSSEIQASQLIHKIQPSYPAIARQIRLQGVVEFTAVISKNGTIENLQLVRGHPMLVAAARDAILQWRYKPTLLSGEPVEVITNIVVNFTLNEQ